MPQRSSVQAEATGRDFLIGMRWEDPVNIFAAAPEARKSAEEPDSAARWIRYLVPIGRTAFSAAFLLFGPMNISQ